MLSQVPLFAGMRAQILARLAPYFSEKWYQAGELICQEGAPTGTMSFVQAGRVIVSLPDEDGQDIPLSELGPQALFGEMALLDSQPASANVTAATETQLLVLARDDFLQFLAEHDEALDYVLATLTHRLREAERRVQQFAQRLQAAVVR